MTTFAAVTTLRTTAARPNVRGWIVAATVYFLAVFHRSSLGVAGLLAEQRFGITAAQLGAFVAAADRRVRRDADPDRRAGRPLRSAPAAAVAAALMALGQLLFAVAPSYPLALLARGLLGCGDAMTFISVLRFAAGKFSARRYPVLLSITGTIGIVGQPARDPAAGAAAQPRRLGAELPARRVPVGRQRRDRVGPARRRRGHAEPVAPRARGARRDRVGVQAGGRRLVAARAPGSGSGCTSPA